MTRRQLTIGFVVLLACAGWVGASSAADYRIGPSPACDVPADLTPDPGLIHWPAGDMFHGPGTFDFGIQDEISFDLRVRLDAPAPRGTELSLGSAHIVADGSAVTLGGVTLGTQTDACAP